MGIIISLIIIGLVLMLAEIMIIPGVGVAGILGIASMGGSCYYAFREYGTSAGYIVLAVTIALLILLLIWALRSKTWKKMALETNITSKANVPEVDVLVGDRGIAVTRLAPMGNVRFGIHVLEAAALEGMISTGAEVEIVMVDDKKIYVKECI
jgi:membrane-bound ClpP family serine protease